MEMLKEFKMDQAGHLHANMETDNVKEISLKLVPLENTIFIVKLSHSSFAYSKILVIGFVKVKLAHQRSE